jgi:hypothetical protein
MSYWSDQNHGCGVDRVDAADIGGDGGSLVMRVLHRFQPRRHVVERQDRAVAGGIDRRVGGAAVIVDDDADRDLQPGGLGQFRIRRDADADNGKIERQFLAIGQPTAVAAPPDSTKALDLRVFRARSRHGLGAARGKRPPSRGRRRAEMRSAASTTVTSRPFLAASAAASRPI